MKRSSLLPGWTLVACLLPVCLLLSWLLLARLEFLYPLWYQVLGIEQHIAQYAPQNRHGKADFALTTPEEHRRLFGEIVRGIHGRAELATIVYRDEQGRTLGRFLHADEVGHLRDVARLVTVMLTVGWILLAGSGALLFWLGRRRFGLPPPGRIAIAVGGLLSMGALTLWLVGPQQVFDLLHEWIFPPQYPWFFYYQDSLMTTTIKAPQIFAAIAASWLLLTLLLYGGIYYLLARWQLRPNRL